MNAKRNRGNLPSSKQAKKYTSCYAKWPIQCHCCQDYILGTSLPLRVCQDCRAVLHPICAFFAHAENCDGIASEAQIRFNELNLSNTPTSIAEWSADIVREWIGASESHRYFYIFNSKASKIVGENLINPEPIIHAVRADDLHKMMLRDAIVSAQRHFPLQSLEGDTFGKVSMSPKPNRRDSWDKHEFSRHYCYCTFHCSMCKLSRGVMSYGVKCRKCGMRFHRMCQHLPDLPPCPIRDCPKKDYVFGQDLSDGFSQLNHRIPIFLKLCTSIIEERLQQTDLNIYVSSARCARLQELCSNHGLDIFYDDQNPMKRPTPPVTLPEELEKELKSVRSLDELAGLLKSYLRELPNPVIPFNVYDDMVALIKKSSPSDDEIQCLVDKIPLPHKYALSHIVEHIGRIHNFLGASHKLSTLFAAFGTILIRPPVTSVKNLALWDRGSDLHSMIVKFVFANDKFKDVNVTPSPVAKSPNLPSFTQPSGLPSSLAMGATNPESITSSSPLQPFDSDGTSSSQGAANSDVYIQFTAIDEEFQPAGLDSPGHQRFFNRGAGSMAGSGKAINSDPGMGLGHGFGHPNYQPMKVGSVPGGDAPATIFMCQKRVEELSEYLSIQKLPFYWEDISKSQEKLLMEKEAIGNFILRKSSSDPSALTLVVKGFDVNFLVKVSNFLRPKEGWGIAAHAPKFPSIGDLVQHYQSNDLSTSPFLAPSSSSFDDQKNSSASITSQTRQSVRLREPVNRDLQDLSATKERLVNDSRDMDERENAIAELKRKLSFIKDTEIPPFVKRKEALQKLCTQLENQQTALKNVKRNLSPEDCQKLVASEELLKNRREVALLMIQSCDCALERLHKDKVGIEGELQKSSNDYSDEVRQQTRRRIVLELYGVQYEDDQLTEQQLFNRENQSLWFYRKSVTRDMATQMFDLCREHGQITNGTFLVRSSREGGYAISVWVNGDVMHLKLQYEDQKYGFAYPYIIYSSITDLVVAYTEASLVMHNHNLDTTLTTPIGHFVEENVAIKKQVESIIK